MTEPCRPEALRLLVTIVDSDKVKKVNTVMQRYPLPLNYQFYAWGTASSEILEILGLGAVKKAVSISVLPQVLVTSLLEQLRDDLRLERAGRGIAFSLPLSAINNQSLNLLTQLRQSKPEIQELYEKEGKPVNTENTHELVLAMIKRGFSEELMTVARRAGATGGTVIHARRVEADPADNFWGVEALAEKEVVAIITTRQQRAALMKAIIQACGPATEARGVVLSMPVDQVAGL